MFRPLPYSTRHNQEMRAGGVQLQHTSSKQVQHGFSRSLCSSSGAGRTANSNGASCSRWPAPVCASSKADAVPVPPKAVSEQKAAAPVQLTTKDEDTIAAIVTGGWRCCARLRHASNQALLIVAGCRERRTGLSCNHPCLRNGCFQGL